MFSGYAWTFSFIRAESGIMYHVSHLYHLLENLITAIQLFYLNAKIVSLFFIFSLM